MESNNWITEALVQFIKSPVWLTPVNSFIDENCNIFTDDSEMKLEYTTIHQKFKSIVDDLLSEFVGELGVSLEDALSAVRSSLQSEHELEHKSVEDFMKYIYVVDDFESFYRMMIKRNVELDIIAVRDLQAKGVNLSVEDSENLLSSISGAAPPTPEDIARIIEANGKCDDEEAFKRAISASLMGDPKAQENKLEGAKLKEALALSAQAERDRAQLSTGDAQKEVPKPLPKRVEDVASKEPKTTTAHQAQVEREAHAPSQTKSHVDGGPVRRASELDQPMAHNGAPPAASEPKGQIPTAINSAASSSSPHKDQSCPLPALTTSKLQQPLGGPKLQPLPPI
ncbi:unnamed protein product [Phytomonas sp. EM1]|nr:unnamed protein product [Phytomonas sp. EM1]|eukprot:CCW60010.1 unnamed protein product [Phytomonas sp. isolate EM1]